MNDQAPERQVSGPVTLVIGGSVPLHVVQDGSGLATLLSHHCVGFDGRKHDAAVFAAAGVSALDLRLDLTAESLSDFYKVGRDFGDALIDADRWYFGSDDRRTPIGGGINAVWVGGKRFTEGGYPLYFDGAAIYPWSANPVLYKVSQRNFRSFDNDDTMIKLHKIIGGPQAFESQCPPLEMHDEVPVAGPLRGIPSRI